jgi:hypothetical protein
MRRDRGPTLAGKNPGVALPMPATQRVSGPASKHLLPWGRVDRPHTGYKPALIDKTRGPKPCWQAGVPVTPAHAHNRQLDSQYTTMHAAHTVCLRACVGMALHAKHSTPLHYCCNTPQQRSTAKRLKPPLRQWAGHTPAMHACMHMHVPVGDSTPPHGS